jgi:hypothetical protein
MNSGSKAKSTIHAHTHCTVSLDMQDCSQHFRTFHVTPKRYYKLGNIDDPINKSPESSRRKASLE